MTRNPYRIGIDPSPVGVGFRHHNRTTRDPWTTGLEVLAGAVGATLALAIWWIVVEAIGWMWP